jgi:hypothetical protein
MAEAFIRVASVTVGKNFAIGTDFAGLRTSFEIEKTSEGKVPNPGKITIYNLAEKTRVAFEDKDLVCILKVGYRGIDATNQPVLKGIFQGNIQRVDTKREGADIKTIIEAGDGFEAIKEKHIDQSFGPFTTAVQAFTQIAAKMGLPLGTIVPGFTDVFTGGLSVSGLASDELDKLTQSAGLEWSVQDGKLNILKPGIPTTETAVVLTSETGLLGVPSKSKVGIEFVSVLNPDLTPGRAVLLTSKAITGAFRVKRVVHTGDTNQGEWISKVEAS